MKQTKMILKSKKKAEKLSAVLSRKGQQDSKNDVMCILELSFVTVVGEEANT
jgi:hypothetical protein